MIISTHLSKGAENARSGRDLCAILGVDARTLTAAIDRERRQGKPICAITRGPQRGYYLAADQEEMERYCASLHHRTKEMQKTLRACLKTLSSLPASDSLK